MGGAFEEDPLTRYDREREHWRQREVGGGGLHTNTPIVAERGGERERPQTYTPRTALPHAERERERERDCGTHVFMSDEEALEVYERERKRERERLDRAEEALARGQESAREKERLYTPSQKEMEMLYTYTPISPEFDRTLERFDTYTQSHTYTLLHNSCRGGLHEGGIMDGLEM